MAASAVKNVRTPVRMASPEIVAPSEIASPSTSTPAPAMAGMPTRKENRAASERLKPKNPCCRHGDAGPAGAGNDGNRLRQSDSKSRHERHVLPLTLTCLPKRSAIYIKPPKIMAFQATISGPRTASITPVFLTNRPKQDGRDGGNDNQQAETAMVGHAARAAGSARPLSGPERLARNRL